MVRDTTRARDSGFSSDAELVVKQLTDEEWKLVEGFSYKGKYETFRIRKGMETDFASVPRVVVWFLPRYGRYTMAAVLHDYLWRHRVPSGDMDYIDADGAFRRAMRELGVAFLRRWIMWAAVRWGALMKPRGLRGWWRESWRVALITLIALPFVLPPALFVALFLGAFQLLEWIVFVPLKVDETRKLRARRTDVKEVNAPTFDWRS